MKELELEVKKSDTEAQTLEEKTPNDDQKENIIDVPDGGYGWVVVFGNICLTTAVSATGSYSIYLAHYLQESSFPNATKLDFAAIGGIQFGGGFVLAPFIGLVVYKFGVKPTIAIGTVSTFLGYFLSGFVKQLWQLYITQGLLVAIGYGFVFVPMYSLVPQWFRKRRALAASLGAAGAGLSGILFNLSTSAIIKHISLRWSYIIQSICCTVLCIVGVLLVKARDQFINPEKPTLFDLSVAKQPIFWLLMFHVFMIMQGYSVLLLSITDFARTLGFDSTDASIVSCMVSVGFTIGRPSVGRISDYRGVVTTTICAYSVVGILCLAMWIPIRNYASVLVFALFQGLLSGTIWVSLSPITSRVFGLRKFKNVMNMIWIAVGVSSIIAPIIGLQLKAAPEGGSLYSPTQYLHTQIYCGITYAAGVLSLLLVRGYLIERDSITVGEQGATMDNAELHINVEWLKAAGSMFKISRKRLV